MTNNSKNLIKSLAHKSESLDSVFSKNVRFSISLSVIQNKRLELLARKCDLSKQEFIAKVIDAAVLDLEEELGLIENRSIDLLGQTQVHYKTSYAREIADAFGPELSEKHREEMGL